MAKHPIVIFGAGKVGTAMSMEMPAVQVNAVMLIVCVATNVTLATVI